MRQTAIEKVNCQYSAQGNYTQYAAAAAAVLATLLSYSRGKHNDLSLRCTEPQAIMTGTHFHGIHREYMGYGQSPDNAWKYAPDRAMEWFGIYSNQTHELKKLPWPSDGMRQFYHKR